MGAPTSDDQIAQRLEELRQSLQELSYMLDHSPVYRRRPEPKLMFPFSLLEQIIAWVLDRLNRAVEWLVKRIIR